MKFFDILKTIGGAIVKGVKAAVSFVAKSSTFGKIAMATVAIGVPVAIAVVEVVKTVKRVHSNTKPSNVLEEALMDDEDEEAINRPSKRAYNKTVKSIANNIGKSHRDRVPDPYTNKKAFLKEIKRISKEIDEEMNMPFGAASEREMREARREMDRISNKVRRRKRFT